ncbi:GntR family transcriptional regulator [Frankia sp. AiPs1]|uniref:FadR/GntR family transcriptional regulator n=1 Tax=Frankia sp. AiPs1 TaxID=573493 RepID=UPI0020431050|nr:FCD domain-containing protein [Frankia sp. AiPs1]MCM3921802.1 GntR family transcriptional regulator [Frankia sp. AiPs1]
MPAPPFARISAPADDTLRVPKTAELVARQLRRMIASGGLRDGDLLPASAELEGRFGVARTSLREAFRILEAESLLTVHRGCAGARVQLPGPAAVARPAGLLLQQAGTTLAEVLTARLGLEPLAAGLLTRRGRDEPVQALAHMVDAMRADLAADRTLAAASSAFHRSVVAGAGNPAFDVLAGMLHEIILRHVANARLTDRLDPAERQHQRELAVHSCDQLIVLIRAGDADRVERFWRRRLATANAALLRLGPPAAKLDVVD